MLLALRPGHAENAGALRRVGARYIKHKLKSDYSHSGLVLDGRMLHVDMAHGLHASSFDPDFWQFVDVGTGRDAIVRELFARLEGTPYDYFGLLGFELPWRATDSARLYCHEWCAIGLGGSQHRPCTVEYLLTLAMHMSGQFVSYAEHGYQG